MPTDPAVMAQFAAIIIGCMAALVLLSWAASKTDTKKDDRLVGKALRILGQFLDLLLWKEKK